MTHFIKLSREGAVRILTLNRPEVMNAWHKPMRDEIIQAIRGFDVSDVDRALVVTGAGSRAFCAGQDLHEAVDFDGDRAESWIDEWELLYGTIRSLRKPVVMALNGVAAGSAFQVALLGDFRIGHPGVRMGQPEINSGIASVTGPWIMREILGLAKTIELTLTGKMIGAEECLRLCLLNEIVPEDQVLPRSIALAEELAAKPSGAMALIKARFREVTQDSFAETFAAARRIHRTAYESGEPAREITTFLAPGKP